MNDQPNCERCSRPIHDQGYACDQCGTHLRRDLLRVALIAGEAAVTIAKQARIGNGGRRTDPDVPLPVNLAAANDHDAAIGVLTTWARHVHEESGRPLPTVRTEPCPHASCTQRRRGALIGPECGLRLPAEHPAAVVAAWLVDQVDWIRHRPEGSEAMDELADACQVLVRVVDRPADRVIVGQCDCAAYLYAVRGAAAVRCGTCGVAYDVESSRADLRRHLDERLLTAAEIATMATYLGLATDRLRCRKLINVWHDRGRILARGQVGDDPTFRFGEVVARLTRAASRNDLVPVTVGAS